MVAVMSHATSAPLILLKSQTNEGSVANSPAKAMTVMPAMRIIHFLCTFIFFSLYRMIICVKSVGDGLSPVFGTAVSISLGMNVVDGTATGVAVVRKEVAVEGEDRLAVAACGEGVGVGILGA